MKKLISFFAFAFVLIFTSCGPAAEDRQAMHTRAKVFQDSIANMIRIAMAEAEAPGNAAIAAPAPSPAAAPAPTAAPKK